MELNENLKNNLVRLRKERNITQDILAASLDISVQAISKWETGVSLPDIMQIPRIARFYGVTIDYLFYNEGNDNPVINDEIPDDKKLRIIQFLGNKMLGADLWEKDKTINLKIQEDIFSRITGKEINTEIWGNAVVNGDINGYVECGGGLNCGNIASYAECGGGVNCGNINGYLECGGGVNCGDIESYLECGGGVNCGNIGSYVECGGGVSCGDITGNVECDGDLKCKSIAGQVECEGDIHVHEIQGNVECSGNITYEK
ncbi:MAG TPA: helix-turn-helix transcriptional regulator [Mobilitalea sp.]|nr:helix-turn-helix transcriptional regulator [Mobilitalea sp.]